MTRQNRIAYRCFVVIAIIYTVLTYLIAGRESAEDTKRAKVEMAREVATMADMWQESHRRAIKRGE